MTIGLVALLVGIFAVPAVLLWGGHRMRRRSRRWQSIFWGAVTGHVLALMIGSVAAMTPAEEWAASDVLRGAAGLWSFLLLPVLGAAVGSLRSPE